MIRKLSFAVFLGMGLLLASSSLIAQEKDKQVILSPRVGPTIDASEREHFELFQEINDFARAVLFQTPDSTYYARIVLIGADGKARDTTVWYFKSYLFMLAEKINHFEELAAWNYQIGQKPETLQVVTDEYIARAQEIARSEEAAKVQAAKMVAESKEGEVVLLLNDGQEIAGELLSVRDSSIIISTIENAEGYGSAGDTAGIVVVSNQRVQKVIIKGESKVLKGMGLGLLIGGAIGAMINCVTYKKPRDSSFHFGPEAAPGAVGVFLGGLGGLAVGAIVGSAASTSDEVIEPLPNHDLSSLKPFARFPGNEPEWLRLIK